MRLIWIALFSLALCAPAFAQNADEPASRDDVILYLRTMHTHDMVSRAIEVEAEGMHNLMRAQIVKEKGTVPPEFDTQFKKAMDELVKGLPLDEITQATIPVYQKHYTKGDLEAMNAFYSSPVGQKVLQELPEVLRESNAAMMPTLSNYLTEWQKRVEAEFKDAGKSTPAPTVPKAGADSAPKN